jgi:hypothetical protein
VYNKFTIGGTNCVIAPFTPINTCTTLLVHIPGPI